LPLPHPWVVFAPHHPHGEWGADVDALVWVVVVVRVVQTQWRCVAHASYLDNSDDACDDDDDDDGVHDVIWSWMMVVALHYVALPPRDDRNTAMCWDLE